VASFPLPAQAAVADIVMANPQIASSLIAFFTSISSSVVILRGPLLFFAHTVNRHPAAPAIDS
jgi:hypothetical protein